MVVVVVMEPSPYSSSLSNTGGSALGHLGIWAWFDRVSISLRVFRHHPAQYRLHRPIGHRPAHPAHAMAAPGGCSARQWSRGARVARFVCCEGAPPSTRASATELSPNSGSEDRELARNASAPNTSATAPTSVRSRGPAVETAFAKSSIAKAHSVSDADTCGRSRSAVNSVSTVAHDCMSVVWISSALVPARGETDRQANENRR